MATTANHPDGGGKFMGAPAEPDEDIAAIAKQISDHAEVIYQTWKARGLAPNEILTCHNSLNAADKFGSVFTSGFVPPTSGSASPVPFATSSPMSPTSAPSPQQSSSPLKAFSNGCKSPSKLPSPPPGVDFAYNGGNSRSNSPTLANASGNLEQFVNKFVVEDKARLATRQKHDGQSAAKNYPSSIQYALQKFERRCASTSPSSDGGIANCASKAPRTRSTSPVAANDFQAAATNQKSFSPTKTPDSEFGAVPVAGSAAAQLMRATNGGGVGVDGSSYAANTSTWPLKTRSEAPVANGRAGAAEDERLEYAQKCQTLPSKMERRSSADQYLDEVAKEEERLINALKTGMVITANDAKMSPSSAATAKLMAAKPANLVCDLDADSAGEPKSSVKTKTRQMNLLTEKMENARRTEAGADVVCGLTPKRGRRVPGDAAGPLEPSSGAHRLNWRVNSGGAAATGAQSGNPVRPFLTRGSVAERVMMFEKCPTEILEKRIKATNASSAPWKNLASDVHTKIQNYSKETNQRKGVYPPHTTLQRHTKANKNVFIPRFYYPHGKPISQHQQSVMFKTIEETFQSFPNSHATKEQFSSITKACGCPLYWKAPLFIACGGEKLGFVELNTFLEYWRDLTAVCHDDSSRFLRIVTRGTKRSYIIPEDLIPLVQDVVNTHPGLAFLKQAPEFHSRYVHTVICRVYYCVNQSWNGQISLAELRKSDFMRAIQLLEEEEDINQVTAYFSYEHFYVIYCKFWELDRDHDLFISKDDLARHSDHALSTRIIDRIFSRTRSKSRNSLLQEGKMSYTDFVIFLLAEEDKRHPRAIEYWFRCMDLDGDGFLSMYELEFFYDEQLQRMEAMGIECLPFEDCLCQMLDMIQPRIPGKISLSDLKRCKMTPIFFDTFFNLEKYLDHEQRDPFASQRDHDNDMSDWDRYAAEEYELLVAEESGNDHCDDVGQYRITENVEEDDIFSSNLDDVLNGPREYVNHNTFNKQNNFLAENFVQPRMTVNDYGGKACHSDSSDDYAGDSDDCSL